MRPSGRVRVPADLDAATDIGAEHRSGLSPGAADRIWEAARHWYAAGMHPAIQVCIRYDGRVVLNRAIGHARGNGPADPPDAEQVPVRTSSAHSAARIEEIPTDNITAKFAEGMRVAVIAGFQGIAPDGRIATLGRGGSDTTAVALAAALKAERCDIYTDVDGVYTTDPRIHKLARRMDRISFEEMLEMASVGAKVLQTRSVELAMAYKVPVRVLSSFDNPETPGPGTVICDEEEIVEKNIVSGITPSHDEAKISLLAVPDEPGRAARIFTLLADANINVDMIVQSPSRAPGKANISFTIPEADLDRAETLLSDAKDDIGYSAIQSDRNVVKVSVIGVGMKSHAGVASVMFKTLADRGINIQNISTSEIKISVLIDSQYTELAVRALHQAYGLDRAA